PEPAVLSRLLDMLAAIGPKRAGTVGGREAAELIRTRMEQAGLAQVGFEEFAFPRRDVLESSLRVKWDQAPDDDEPLAHDVLDGPSGGKLEAELVFVGPAGEAELAGRDLTGRIALVSRHRLYHRSTQYQRVAAAGAVAMVYVSSAPDNLRQVGS